MTVIRIKRSSYFLAVLVLFLLSACGGGDSDSDSGSDSASKNLSPTASAGEDQYHNFTGYMEIDLDGSQSSDPEGEELTYSWTIISSPDNSSPSINNSESSPLAKLIVSSNGIYEVQLTVTDTNGNTSKDNVVITINAIPNATISAIGNSVTGDSISLDGAESSDDDGDQLTYHWSIASSPESSSSVLSDSNSPVVSITPDVEGIYTFELIVNDGLTDSPSSLFILNVFRKIEGLGYRPIDAEYNIHTDKIIMVSTNPNQLQIYDPVTNENTAVDLPLVPTSVSVGPDGLFAAVGHDAWVSYVDLNNASLVKNIAVSTDVVDIILAGNNYIYAFPRTDQWETIRSLNINTEAETLSTGNSIRAGTLVKLHPSGNSIYGADNGLSPSDIEKYNIKNGPAEYLYDSPYHGDFSMCGDLWMSKEGARIFTRCGNVFRSSELQSEDMIYNGSFDGISLIRQLDHSVSSNEVTLIPDNYSWNDTDEDTKIYKYDYDFLVYKEESTLPSFVLNGNAYPGHGRYVFYHSSGEQIFVIVQADEESGFLMDYGIVTY